MSGAGTGALFVPSFWVIPFSLRHAVVSLILKSFSIDFHASPTTTPVFYSTDHDSYIQSVSERAAYGTGRSAHCRRGLGRPRRLCCPGTSRAFAFTNHFACLCVLTGSNADRLTPSRHREGAAAAGFPATAPSHLLPISPSPSGVSYLPCKAPFKSLLHAVSPAFTARTNLCLLWTSTTKGALVLLFSGVSDHAGYPLEGRTTSHLLPL